MVMTSDKVVRRYIHAIQTDECGLIVLSRAEEIDARGVRLEVARMARGEARVMS